YPGIVQSKLIHEAVRRGINAMVEDLLAETRRRIADANPRSVADSRALGRRVVIDLFELLFAEPNCLPPPWRERAEQADEPARARIVADYIAGMTDRYALDEHRR